MNMMAITLAFLLDAHDERAIGTRYFVIRSMIYRYLKQKNEGVLHDPSLANFILRRTKMSRSYLFQVLSDLKNGGYITMKNGELVDIVNELPEKYYAVGLTLILPPALKLPGVDIVLLHLAPQRGTANIQQLRHLLYPAVGHSRRLDNRLFLDGAERQARRQ